MDNICWVCGGILDNDYLICSECQKKVHPDCGQIDFDADNKITVLCFVCQAILELEESRNIYCRKCGETWDIDELDLEMNDDEIKCFLGGKGCLRCNFGKDLKKIKKDKSQKELSKWLEDSVSVSSIKSQLNMSDAVSQGW